MSKCNLFCLSCLLLTGCAMHPVIEIPYQPCLIPVKEDRFMLCDHFIVSVDGQLIIIPKGFITDLASIPRIFWAIDAPNDTESIAPAILHDYMYAEDSGLDYSRHDADRIFYYALLSNGASRLTAFKYWLGVRVFGRRFYKADLC